VRPAPVAAALVLAIALAGAISAAMLVNKGHREAGGADLHWAGQPALVPARGLPDDAIATGRIRNDTPREVDLMAADLVVVDDRGRRWRTSGRFMQGFAHGLWPPSQKVAVGSDAERERIGEIAKLDPGESAPLTVAWSKPPGAGRPVRIELGGRTLSIPAKSPSL